MLLRERPFGKDLIAARCVRACVLAHLTAVLCFWLSKGYYWDVFTPVIDIYVGNQIQKGRGCRADYSCNQSRSIHKQQTLQQQQ